MSSPFQKQFSSKSPLHGAYASGADGMVTVSDAPHYAKLQNDILGATLASLPTQEEKGEAQVRRADRRDAREEAGGSKVKKFLDKNKLGFLTANYTKDSDKDGVTNYEEKTKAIRASGEKKIADAKADKTPCGGKANVASKIVTAAGRTTYTCK
tara:strand:- start:33 stop:494 length:462 start_codon:yes stop_codon:yes gene_type:complete